MKQAAAILIGIVAVCLSPLLFGVLAGWTMFGSAETFR